MYGTNGAFGDVTTYGGSCTSDTASRLVVAANIESENNEKNEE